MIDPWDPHDGPAGERRPAPRRLVPRLPQPPRRRRSTCATRRRDLTEQVEVGDGESFVIHPGEFCLGRTEEWVELPDDIVARIEGKSLARAPRADRPRDRRVRRPRLEGDADARDHQPHARPDHAVAGHADRPAVVHDARPPGRAPVRPPRARQPLPRPGRGDRESATKAARPRRPAPSDRFRAAMHLTLLAEAAETERPRPRSSSPAAVFATWASCCPSAACANECPTAQR